MKYVDAVGSPELHNALIVTLEEGSLDRIENTAIVVARVAHGEAVDEKVIVGFLGTFVGNDVGNLHERAVFFKTREALLCEHIEMVAERASFGKDNAGENGKSSSGRVGVNGFDDIFGSVALHHFARNGGKRLTHASEEHAQVVVDFGGSSHGAS